MILLHSVSCSAGMCYFAFRNGIWWEHYCIRNKCKNIVHGNNVGNYLNYRHKQLHKMDVFRNNFMRQVPHTTPPQMHKVSLINWELIKEQKQRKEKLPHKNWFSLMSGWGCNLCDTAICKKLMRLKIDIVASGRGQVHIGVTTQIWWINDDIKFFWGSRWKPFCHQRTF